MLLIKQFWGRFKNGIKQNNILFKNRRFVILKNKI